MEKAIASKAVATMAVMVANERVTAEQGMFVELCLGRRLTRRCLMLDHDVTTITHYTIMLCFDERYTILGDDSGCKFVFDRRDFTTFSKTNLQRRARPRWAMAMIFI